MDSARKTQLRWGASGLGVGLLIGTLVFVIMLVSQSSTEDLYKEAIRAAVEGPLDDVALRYYDGMKIYDFMAPNSRLLLVDNPSCRMDPGYHEKYKVIKVSDDALRFFRQKGYVAAVEFLMWKDFQKREKEKYLKPMKDKEKEEY